MNNLCECVQTYALALIAYKHMKTILTVYHTITNIVVSKQIMTLKRCQELTQQFLDEGYEPIKGFKPGTNEGYTNGIFTIMWDFK